PQGGLAPVEGGEFGGDQLLAGGGVVQGAAVAVALVAVGEEAAGLDGADRVAAGAGDYARRVVAHEGSFLLVGGHVTGFGGGGGVVEEVAGDGSGADVVGEDGPGAAGDGVGVAVDHGHAGDAGEVVGGAAGQAGGEFLLGVQGDGVEADGDACDGGVEGGQDQGVAAVAGGGVGVHGQAGHGTLLTQGTQGLAGTRERVRVLLVTRTPTDHPRNAVTCGFTGEASFHLTRVRFRRFSPC